MKPNQVHKNMHCPVCGKMSAAIVNTSFRGQGIIKLTYFHIGDLDGHITECHTEIPLPPESVPATKGSKGQ